MRRRGILGLAASVATAHGLAKTALGASDAGRRKPAPPPNVTVATHRGKVRGAIDDGIKSFKGIPYGAPTDGMNRFRPPKPARDWSETRDATGFGPMCPQLDRERISLTASWTDVSAAGEDCLLLNVWTPGLRDQRKRPVMVWLHGGGFASGSASRNVFDGARLCRRGDIVVVTVNHRLNVFGFLYLAHLGGAEFAESGNVGLLDLVAALRWVHDNIAAFGGDPGNVTIFGQSGGGAKVSVLMAMPQTRGLFHKAIVQSGSQLDGLSPEEATRHALVFLAALDVKPVELFRLAKLPVDKLVAALKAVMGASGPRPVFGPVVDAVVLPRQPWQPDAPVVTAAIPMIIGSTRTETTALIGADDPSVFEMDEPTLHRKLSGWLPERDISRVVAGFRRLLPNASTAELYFAITTDRQFRQQAWAQAERKAMQGSGAVWLYELDWSTPVDGGKWGSPHSLDLALVFDNVAKSAAMVGNGPEPQQLAEAMSSAWIAFARSGTPNASGLPDWPPFSVSERSTMVFDDVPRAAADFRGAERMLLAGLPLYRVSR